MRNLYYIAIEGPIGVGKTSLAQLLSKELGARLVLEDFEDNPFLPDFYNDPERFGFQTQLFFLLQRYRQQQDLRQVDICLLYTSPSPRDATLSRMPSSA